MADQGTLITAQLITASQELRSASRALCLQVAETRQRAEKAIELARGVVQRIVDGRRTQRSPHPRRIG